MSFSAPKYVALDEGGMFVGEGDTVRAATTDAYRTCRRLCLSNLPDKDLMRGLTVYRLVASITKWPEIDQHERVEEAAPAALDDIRRVVLGFKAALGIAAEDKAWDRVYFRRFSRAARDLIGLFAGDMDRIAACIEGVASAMDRKGLTWTPETLVKHAGDWRAGRVFK